MRPRATASPPGSWAALVAVIVTSLLVQLALQWAEAGYAGRPTTYGLPGALLPVSLVLLAVALVAVPLRRGAYVLPLATVVLAAALWMEVALTLAGHAMEATPAGRVRGVLAWALQALPSFWLALTLALLLARRLALDARGALLAIGAAVLLVGWPLMDAGVDRTLWAPPVDAGAEAHREAMRAVVSEDVLYLQPRLLASELAALEPPRAGVPNLYLVSVAGYAGQDVFMREVDSVDRLFRERFGTAGHSVRLVNNPATLRERPLATRTALIQALARVGQLMDPDRDVLFLFLTSHGSPDHRFSLSFWPLGLYDLTPAHLRQMLDDAHIRNRVVVVSACYSGGFVEALKDPHTLVITAAAADRSSFGCSNEADFTWFGRAYFDEALRHTRSFTEAFALAAPAIAAREQAEGYDPSLPQIDVGGAIGAPLGELVRALD